MQIHAGALLEIFGQKIDQAQVEILTTQEGIAIGRQYFKGMFAVGFCNLDDGNIEGSTAKIVYRNLGIAFFLVHAKRKCRSCRLVDNAFYIKACDATCIFGGLALGVIEIRRYGNNRSSDWFTQVIFCSFFHFHQHLG